MTGYTTPDNLPYPNNYNDPADVPDAINDLAQATQAALDTKPDGAGGAGASGEWPINISGGSVRANGQLFNFHDRATIPQYLWCTDTNGDSYLVWMKYLDDRWAPYGHGLIVNGANHHYGTVPANATMGPVNLPHGLGKLPLAVTVTPIDDTGAQSVVFSVQGWDETNVAVLARNLGSSSEDISCSIIAVG